MKAEIDYDPSKQRFTVYLGTAEVAVYRGPNGEMLVHRVMPGDERPPFLTLSREEYESIADAVLLRESPRNADPALLREMLNDTRGVRDRLLDMLEGER